MSSHEPAGPRRVAGCDLGKASVKLVVARVGRGDAGAIVVEHARSVAHDGRPLEVFAALYRELDVASCEALGATGLFADELVAPALTGLPEDACLEAALSARRELAGPLRLVSVGARGYSVLSRSDGGRVAHVENDKCSSGAGETAVKLAARFGLDIEEADRVALAAARGIAITSRCSVFAKSEMTHFANAGRAADELLRGYFESIARHVAALVERTSSSGPLYVIGGGSRSATLARALSERLGVEARVPSDALFFEALGAASLAAEQAESERPPPLPRDPEALLEQKTKRVRVLEPSRAFAHRVRYLEAPAVPAGAERAPTVLGLDIGSTGSKAVLTSIDSGEAVLDVYDRTRGNPVDAAARLVGAVARHAPDIRAIGVTGSGREAVATLLRAAFSEAASRIVVINEIVAHASAAIRCDPGHGKSLSIVEIGGQDAKYVLVEGGQIVESDLNKACSAGTGSFLEEQANLYGVDDIADFGRMAESATRPPDLGQMCTVFVADAAASAEKEGFTIPDLFAGFEYAVIHNYKNRVMGERTFGERVFFQGKPASGRSLAWTLAAVTGREVVVPPNPGAMGAWGIGLCALEQLDRRALVDAEGLDLSRVLGATVVERAEIRCQDPKCGTLCRIDKTLVEIGAERRTVFSGGACPKWEIPGAAGPKLPAFAPSAFDERDALLAPHRAGRPGGAVVDVPEVGAIVGVLPWVTTFLGELGLGVRVLRPDARSLARGEERCYSYDACAPVKVAHAVVDARSRATFFPKLLGFADREGPGGATCAMEQALPEMVAQALDARGGSIFVVAPRLDLRSGRADAELYAELGVAAAKLGADVSRVPAATRAAFEAQETFERALRAIGERTLDYGRRHRVPVVVVCGAQHVVFDPGINAGIPSILRQNGALALPMDAFPIDAEVHELPRIVWGDANRALRVALAARARGDAYALLLSSFGCGPASFAEHVFAKLMAGHPHTSLESDGHGGGAGYVTRVQAFLHAVRAHDGRPSRPSAARLHVLEPLYEPPLSHERGSRLVVMSLAPRLSPMLAAVYRSFGYDAVAAGPNTASSLALGRRDCSGKECLPYQLIWGAFRTALEADASAKRKVLLEVAGDGACRNCMFSVKDTFALEGLGLGERVGVRHLRPEPELATAFALRFFSGAIAWDILHQLVAYHRALEPSPGDADRLYHAACDELEALLARRSSTRLAGAAAARRDWPELLALLARAAREFAALGSLAPRRSSQRTVLLTGDVYLRLDELGSDDLARRLARRGLRVLIEPFSVLAEYLAAERSSDLLGLPTGLLMNAVYRASMATIRRSLYGRVIPLHPWLPMPDVGAMIELSRSVLARSPVGEAPITVGSVLHAWRERVCDGVVVVGPWGCGPALIAESLLKHRREIPTLFVYADGSPLDERRLNAFAFRLRREQVRARGIGEDPAPVSRQNMAST